MGRHVTNIGSFWRQGGPRWADPYYREWAVVVGDRIRRLRQERGWPIAELSRRVRKPEGGHYSAGYFSRLERGWGSAPLYVYIVIAEALEVDPGVLLAMIAAGDQARGGGPASLPRACRNRPGDGDRPVGATGAERRVAA